MANEAFVAREMVMLKPQVPTEKIGETMFWKRKRMRKRMEILARFAVLKTKFTPQRVSVLLRLEQACSRPAP